MFLLFSSDHAEEIDNLGHADEEKHAEVEEGMGEEIFPIFIITGAEDEEFFPEGVWFLSGHNLLCPYRIVCVFFLLNFLEVFFQEFSVVIFFLEIFPEFYFAFVVYDKLVAAADLVIFF